MAGLDMSGHVWTCLDMPGGRYTESDTADVSTAQMPTAVY